MLVHIYIKVNSPGSVSQRFIVNEMGFQGLISREGTVLVIVDVQERLFPHIAGKEKVAENIRRLIKFAHIVKMPIVFTEQYPSGLGRTIKEIKDLIPNIQPMEKVEFNCFRSPQFNNALQRLEAKTIILTGIETHICISQTAVDGSSRYRMCVVSDAVSSRSIDDKLTGLERMKQAGVTILSTEMFIYEILEKAGTKEFRETLELVR